MRYSRLTITNFKGIGKVELDLDRPPRSPVFALVGLNESGKTTILEAINWLYSPDPYDYAELIPKSELGNFNGEIAVEADATLTSEDQDEIAKILRKSSRSFTLTEPIQSVTLKRAYSYADSEKVHDEFVLTVRIVGKTRQMKQPREVGPDDPRHASVVEFITQTLLPPIIYYENFLFDFPDKIYLEAKPEQILTQKDQVYREVIQDVLNSIDPTIRITSHIVERHKGGGRQHRFLESVLLQLAAKMTSEVFTIWKTLLKLDLSGRVEITLGQQLIEDEKGYYIEVKVKEGDQSFFIRERSLGFRWFFAFILFTHFRGFRYRSHRKALFLLDEPASNLHPTAQSKILSVFENFPNKQDVIYATHSHHMINPKWLAGTFVVKNEAKEYSQVDVTYHAKLTRITCDRYFHFAASRPNDTDFFRPILDALDYQLTTLEHAPELVILEGKNDYYTLKYMREMGYVSSSVGEHFFPGAGKDKVDYIVGLYIGWSRNFIVLLDDDSGGRETHSRLSKMYGPLLDSRVFRLVHVHRDWKGFSLERLFLESDYPKVMKTIYPTQDKYDKVKFNTALQDCYVNSRKLPLHTNTVARFQKVFDFLESKLAEKRK